MAEQKNDKAGLAPIDAGAFVEVSSDRLKAVINLSPPGEGGATLDADQLDAVLAKKNINFGILDDVLEDLARNPSYGHPILIAEGRAAVNGESAQLVYHINAEKDFRPKVKKDGSVDFKDLHIIEQVAEGALLCEKIPATPGQPGMDVFGKALPAKQGRDLTLPAGKNTVMSEDKCQLFSAIEGQAEIVNKKINILDTFVVDGDVSNATGNIKFSGNVVINGGVQAGFVVEAEGNVDVSGIVESAKIIAQGAVIIRGGFSGGEKGEINAGGNVTVRFIQGGRITLGGNLESTYILNAFVHCSGSVNLSGKGLIMGGHVIARTAVSAASLGSASTTASTVIEVGNDPKLAKRYHEIPKELLTCEKNLQSVRVLATTFLQLKQAGRLTPDKIEPMEKAVAALKQLSTQQVDLQEEFETVKTQLAEAGHGTVRVSKKAFPGVKIIIGAEQLTLQSEYSFTAFIRTSNGISAGPMR